MEKSPLYTRTGDAGMTSLVGGARVPKYCARVCAYGTVDELNAMIGLVEAHCTDLDDFVTATLRGINNTLFSVGAHLATDCPPQDDSNLPAPVPDPLRKEDIETLEHAIDLLDSLVAPLHAFVLPGGSVGAAQAHVARTVCRRAERDILTLAASGAYVAPSVITYINRLSDYLFILARYINHFTGTPETTWRQPDRD